MKTEKEERIPLKEVKRQVEIAARRNALLHLSYAKTLIEEFGEEKGKKLILKAIKNYGVRIAEKVMRGHQDEFPFLTGLHERKEWVKVNGEKRRRVWGCVLAREWREWGEDSVGRLYCYVDPAKSMALNPLTKLVHTKAAPDGDDYCELVYRSTTEKERKDFADKNEEWDYVDKESEQNPHEKSKT